MSDPTDQPSNEKPKTEEERYADRVFPEQVTIPIVTKRIGTSHVSVNDPSPYKAAYALNAPTMKSPITFVIGVDRTANISVAAHRAMLEAAVAAHIGGEVLRLACEAQETRDAAAAAKEAGTTSVRPAYPTSFGPDDHLSIGSFGDGPPAGTCTRPPPGWYCTREEGHDGPCPARELPTSAANAYAIAKRRTQDAISAIGDSQDADRVTATLGDLVDAAFALERSRLVDGAEAPDQPDEDAWNDEHVTQFFAYAQLPEHLQNVSKAFHAVARWMMGKLPRNQERTKGLNKLLEAKDCAVRAAVAKTAQQRKEAASSAPKATT